MGCIERPTAPALPLGPASGWLCEKSTVDSVGFLLDNGMLNTVDNTFIFQLKEKHKRSCAKYKRRCKTSKRVQRHCMVTCGWWRPWTAQPMHQDASLAKFAILNF